MILFALVLKGEEELSVQEMEAKGTGSIVGRTEISIASRWPKI
jgi:hypothetical protein